MKVDINKLDLNKLVNFRTYLNNLNIELDNLDVDKLLVMKNTKFNTQNTKVSNLDKKIPDAPTLI